jgi:hypothetical protein
MSVLISLSLSVGIAKGHTMTVQVYPKALLVSVIVLLLALMIGAWSMAAVWRIGAIAVIAAVVVQRFRGKRLTTKF